jgi:hypothetical protein
LKGYGSFSGEEYALGKDAISNRTFEVVIDGKNSFVKGSNGLSFIEITPNLIVGIYISGGKKGAVETWGVDVEKGKAFYTLTRSGYTVHDGAKLFVGTLEGKCK